MLRFFNSAHPLFPVRWANAVTGWLLGLCSDSGSITIRNTATPGRGDGPSIDVNLAWAKSLIASETPRPETERPTEDLVPPEEWETDAGDGKGQKQETTGIDGETTVEAYPCCGKSILPAAADHQHKSNIAPTSESVPEAYSESGSVGSSVYAARLDHKHPYPDASEVTANDGETVTTVEAVLEDHNARITKLEDQEVQCDCAEKWTEQVSVDEAQDADIEQAQSDATDAKTKVDAIVTNVGKDGATSWKVPLTALTGNINGHSGTCYVTIDNDGNLGHSQNKAYNLLNAAKDTSATKLLTDADLSDDQIKTLQEAAKDISDMKTTVEEMQTTVETASTNATDAKTAAEAAKTSAEGAQSTADAAAAKIAAVTVSVGSGGAAATKVPLSALTGNVDGHAGTCLVTIGNDGSLGHTNKSGADVDLLGAAADRMNKGDGTTKLLTNGDLSDDDVKNLDNIATAAADGTVTQDITVCTGIAWQYVQSAGGYALVFTTQTLKFKSGLLVEVGTAKSTYNEYDGKAS